VLIGEIFPPLVAVAEVFGDPPLSPLFPEEEALVAKAVTKRRREFTAARGCARAALGQLGLPPSPIGRGPKGAPQWPSGIVGSITHCAGYAAAAAARASDIVTVGLDAEPHDRLPERVLGAIALPQEQARVAELAADWPGTCWDRVLFCAKETVYKAWFPLTQRWLGFEDARIDLDPGGGSFTARLLVDGRCADGRELTGFSGRFLISQGLIVTSIAVSRLTCALVQGDFGNGGNVMVVRT
jgi:4'-phosphopantetheinyl transferase EntD